MSNPSAGVPRLMIAAPASGSGKTTVAVAVMHQLARRGLRVAPFKVGPDYIDPTHHRAAAGRASRNLDGWMLPHDTVVSLFRRATEAERAADVAVLEGVMGLFDGHSPLSERGSTAEMAKLLRAPVVLVLDASAMARTAAAVVHGMHTFDPDLRLAGVILNHLGSQRHFEICRDAVQAATAVPVLGWLPRDPELSVPERHLGLVLAAERGIDLERIGARSAETLDVDALLRIARDAPPLPPVPDPLPPRVERRRARIAVARDAAFDFYYEDNLDLLRDLGAELRFFSPLSDTRLPKDVGALYIGGGYPELHAGPLSANAALHHAIREFAASGRPVYAECGGLMYLSEVLIDAEGASHPMVGLVPGRSVMRQRPVLGYREAVALHPSPIAERGWTVRGHEFHYSVVDAAPARPAYRRVDGTETEGALGGPGDNVLASYIHVHFASDPRLAQRLVELAAVSAAPFIPHPADHE